MKDWFYTPREVGLVLGWNPQYIRDTARTSPHLLPFPVVTHGSRTQVPKAPFDAWFAAQASAKGYPED